MKLSRVVGLLCLSAVIAFASAARGAELGLPAPALSIERWVKGDAVDLKEGKGKNICVIEFWATWCPPCRESIPHLTEMQKQFKDKGVVFLGVSDEPLGTVKSFVAKMGAKMDYRVAVDKDRQTSKAYMEAFGIGDIPHAFVVDKTGVIAWQGHPMAGLEHALEQMVAGKYDLEAAKKAMRTEELAKEYFKLVSAAAKDPLAAELGKQIVADAAANPHQLNEMAWSILTDQKIRNRDLPLALRAAKLAFEATGGKEAAIVDTYARALFDTGEKTGAVKLQKQAIALCQDPVMKPNLEKTLAGYEKQLAQ